MKLVLLAGIFALCLTLCCPPKPATPKRFYLWGGGEMPDHYRGEFIRMAGGKVVIIPLASSEPEKAVTPWLGRPNVVVYSSEEDLDDASGVWFSGGDQKRLVDALGPLKGKLKRMSESGVLMGGTSAGCSAMSDVMIYEDTESVGFGMTDVVMDQHFDARDRLDRLKKLLDKHPGLSGLGVDEGGGILMVDDEVTVLKGGATYCDKNGNVKKYNSGDRFSLTS